MRVMPAEWEEQSGVMLAWPHGATDWKDNLLEAEECYRKIAGTISKYEKVVILSYNKELVRKSVGNVLNDNIILVESNYNDTWVRDFGPISVKEGEVVKLLDFQFNGWGKKFDARDDNQVNRQLAKSHFNGIELEDHNHFILEGGSIESDGKGTILTTSHCLMAPNRNQPKTKLEIENYMRNTLGAQRIIWLEYGWLEGDDTDGHIDTTARFCNENTIAYMKCENPEDSHFYDFSDMEKELKLLRNSNGDPYNLIPLPFPDPVFAPDGRRLPATYANFLIINNAVLMPFYNCDRDNLALRQLSGAFPDREVIGINCLPLILQHGSLHCVTMQLPAGVL